MKNRYTISIVLASLYFIASIFLFLIAKEKINFFYAYFSILVGLIGAVYYIVFSLKQSLRQDLTSPSQEPPIRKYLIASDITLFFIFIHLAFWTLIDKELFRIIGAIIAVANVIFWLISDYKIRGKHELSKKLLIIHAIMGGLLALLL